MSKQSINTSRYSKTPGLAAAIIACGGVTTLANKVGVHQTTISNWGARGRIPAEQVIKVEAATGGKVSRHELRPDIYEADKPRKRNQQKKRR